MPDRFQVECFYTVLFQKSIVQAYHQVQTSVETVPYIEGARSGGISLKCKISVLPWELVPHCVYTPLKCSSLVLTSLRIITNHV